MSSLPWLVGSVLFYYLALPWFVFVIPAGSHDPTEPSLVVIADYWGRGLDSLLWYNCGIKFCSFAAKYMLQLEKIMDQV